MTGEIDTDTNVPSNDCISRQAAIKLAIDLDCESRGIIKESKCREIENRYNMIPAAQPQRMRGRWMESDTDGFVCSVCHNGYKMQPTLMGKPMFEFCPICGAQMEGQE